MENRIKECQLDLFADRTSTATMRANQLRLWFASIAYVLMAGLSASTQSPSAPAKQSADVATCGGRSIPEVPSNRHQHAQSRCAVSIGAAE